MNKKTLPFSSFTLVELLIVVSILGILSGLVISVINPARLQKGARDANRRKDLAVVAETLEQYYADWNRYPVTSDYSAATFFLTNNGYISTAPTDPKDFSYCYTSTGQTFVLCAAFEKDPAETNGVTPCMTLPSGSTGIYCFPNPF